LANPFRVLQQDEKRGLERIFGVGLGPSQIPARGPHEAPVPPNEFHKRLLVVVDESPQQLRIRHRWSDVGERTKHGLEQTRGHRRAFQLGHLVSSAAGEVLQ
jgi:hypothetical protein